MYGSSAEHPHGEDIFYYLTVYNEPYLQPPSPPTSRAARKRSSRASCAGLYRYRAAAENGDPSDAAAPKPPIPNGPGPVTARGQPPQAQILASGVAVRMGTGRAGAAGRRLGCGRRRLVGDVLDRAAP